MGGSSGRGAEVGLQAVIRRWLSCIVLLAAVFVTGPACGDWVVVRGGSRIETRGPWQEKGSQIVFTRADGTLVTLPAALVDLAASRAATAAAKVPPTPTPRPTPRRPVLVLTDADVAHVVPSSYPPTTAENTTPQDGPRPAEANAQIPTVILFTTSRCSWCRKAKTLLAELGVPYIERNIGADPQARGELARLTGGSLAVPVLQINGTVVQGYQPNVIRQLLGRGRHPEAAPGPR